MSVEPSLILLSRPRCHLCDGVRGPLTTLAEIHGLRLEELSVDADPRSEELFGQRIPVLLWDGAVVAEGRFNPQTAIDWVLARLPDERFGNSAER
ncbi:MAG: glutaredoxin family protein [Candidatus Dormibacteria bacterium]